MSYNDLSGRAKVVIALSALLIVGTPLAFAFLSSNDVSNSDPFIFGDGFIVVSGDTTTAEEAAKMRIAETDVKGTIYEIAPDGKVKPIEKKSR